MLIYLLCGVFSGALLGSWAAYWLARRRAPRRDGAVFTPEPAGADAPERAQADQAKKQAEEAMRRLEEGLYSVLFYDRKKTGRGGDLN